jgi:hypothetical protein
MSYRTAYIQTAFFVIASAFALAVLRFWPAHGEAPVAAVFPPGWSAERSFAAAASAGAAILSPGGWSNVVVVAADADTRDRLAHQGVLVLLDAEAFDACMRRVRPSLLL